ncbi:alpha/beta-Hydrolases superfamily protein [Perilla frutescens var. frutescens]|nr:alpha/beta-Hydrolases superfamily protein [Perilla frutescens var. frutescens]
MQRAVDNVLAVTKESVKTFTYEALHNIVRLINGVSALLLSILPGKASILEGIHGWELRPTFRGPRLPRWMENGVSSFNQFIHEFSVDSDTSSSVDYSSDGEDCDIYPPSPLSQSSRFSRESSFTKHNRSWIWWIRCIISWVLFPVKLLFGLPLYFINSALPTSKAPARSGNHPSIAQSPRRLQTLKDNFVQRATDRRRGVVEDLHLGIEIFIESAFDVVHKAAHSVLSPVDTFRSIFQWFSSKLSVRQDIHSEDFVTSCPTTVLSDKDPTPSERKTSFNLNTDARTCQDVITELGYPYEAIRVVTDDGYVLLLERIPRRDSRKVVYLQHGILDSSMGWVSNGVVGSPAFAAFDQGYDVFLGNFRGLISREHVNKKISSRQYWKYSINEHGTQDIPAMIEKIHDIKISELKSNQSDLEEESNTDQPYKLCAICHSLGGAGILIYAITRRIEEKPHRLSRMILLSPAGFHHDSTAVFTMSEYLFFMVAPLLALFLPAFYIPTRFFRMLLNKLARDFHNLPAVGGLVQTLMSYVVGGDSSNWVGVLGLPHYNMNDMPGVSFRVALHLAQMKRSKKFVMFDYGSKAANMEVYGSPEPLNLGDYYGFIDIPVDLVAGRKDRVIKPSMVRKHYKLMKDAGVEVSFSEFEYAHLDFTFSHREELLSYVMSRLLLVGPPLKQMHKPKSLKVRRKDLQVKTGNECN